jgi:hypothetical protein
VCLNLLCESMVEWRTLFHCLNILLAFVVINIMLQIISLAKDLFIPLLCYI